MVDTSLLLTSVSVLSWFCNNCSAGSKSETSCENHRTITLAPLTCEENEKKWIEASRGMASCETNDHIKLPLIVSKYI